MIDKNNFKRGPNYVRSKHNKLGYVRIDPNIVGHDRISHINPGHVR